MVIGHRERGVTWADLGGLAAALFHLSILLTAVAVIVYGLSGDLFK